MYMGTNQPNLMRNRYAGLQNLRADGHSHGNYHDPKGRACLDMGVDATEFYPVSLLELKARLESTVR